jgi:hypothetical protein
MRLQKQVSHQPVQSLGRVAELKEDSAGRTFLFHNIFQYVVVQVLYHALDLIPSFIAAPVISATSLALTYAVLQHEKRIGFLQLMTFPIETGRVELMISAAVAFV